MAPPRHVRIEKTKYDGTVRRFCVGQLLDHSGPLLRVKVPAGTPVYVTREARWVPSGDTALHCYFEDRWYNVWHLKRARRCSQPLVCQRGDARRIRRRNDPLG